VKRCWDYNPENRPTAKEKSEIIKLAETKDKKSSNQKSFYQIQKIINTTWIILYKLSIK
jgi:hypothetical protein